MLSASRSARAAAAALCSIVASLVLAAPCSVWHVFLPAAATPATIHAGIYDIGAAPGVIQALQRAHWKGVTVRIVQNLEDADNLRRDLPAVNTTDPNKGLGTGDVHRCARKTPVDASTPTRSQCNG